MGTITLAPVDVAGMRLNLSFAASVTAVRVYRYDPSGFVQYIRSGDTLTLTGGQASIVDYEAPLDTDVKWEAIQVTPPGAEVATSAFARVDSDGYSYLKDPGYPSRNLRVPVTTSVATLNYAARAGVFNVIDRATPIVVTALRQAATGPIVLHTLTEEDRLAMYRLLSPGKVLLFQTPPEFGWGSQYIHVGEVEEARVGLAMEQSRKWTLPVVVTDRPYGIATTKIGRNWSDVKTTWLTWGDLKASAKTWKKVLEGT